MCSPHSKLFNTFGLVNTLSLTCLTRSIGPYIVPELCCVREMKTEMQ